MAPPPPPRTLSPSSSSPSLRSSGRRPAPVGETRGKMGAAAVVLAVDEWVRRGVAGPGGVAVPGKPGLCRRRAPPGNALGKLREARCGPGGRRPGRVALRHHPHRGARPAARGRRGMAARAGDLRARCFFSARAAAPLPECPALAIASAGNGNGNGAGGVGGEQRQRPVSVAGVGSAVFFRGTEPFSLRDWRAIKRFLPRDCPLIRAYGAIRFDATSDHSVEWEEFGSFYFIVPQVEYNELEESSVLATTIAWDDSLSWTWQNAVKELQSTLQKISSSPIKVNNSTLQTTILNLNHVPTKASWDLAVTKALQMIKGKQRELVKVVLARCSRYITDTCIDPVELLACLKVEGQNAYQFCIQPPDAPAFVGNSMICDDVVVHPSKALRKLPRVQHLSAQLAARMRNEDDEFDILNTLHPSPAVCGLPTEEARQFIQDYEIFDRGMYAGPVGWFGGAESEFAVGIRSALLGKGHSTLVYAGAGIVEGTNPSFEWDELDLKASQFAKLLQYQEQHICLQEAENMGTVI
ncbi:hypothetical protein OsJ_29067 [Oryza sativa Japonica Group]|uniref:Chorismate-utilising enzyme C-terminal domain-containing protein n=1 Tax=Oryza sativa subsp. japonica TaxID=39947 RepID=A3BY15_ORYSJ|nr:hypothetical protein OsJ_29067 [Oryza sativa Japonica Group]